MTPKAKAFHLHFSFIRDVIADNDKAKICALKVVDEIISNRERIKGIDKLYWQQVKHEIEQL